MARWDSHRWSKGFLTSGIDPRNLSENAVHSDMFDRDDYNGIRTKMGALANKIDDLVDIAPTGRPLMEDMFQAFHKAAPTRRTADEMKPSHLLNHVVEGQAEELPEYHRLRLSTVNDPFAAAMACVAIEPELATLADRQQQRQKQAEALEEKMIEAADARIAQQSLEDALAELEEPTDEQMQAAADAAQQAQDLADEAEAMGTDLQNGIDGDLSSIRASMQGALEGAAEQAGEAKAAAKVWGLEPGQLKRMPAAERMALAKRVSNNPNLKAKFDLFGSMVEFAFAQQRNKVNFLRDEIFDVTMGDDLAHVLPSEFAKLGDDDLEPQFLSDLVEKRLPQYDLRGTEKLAKGGVVYLGDGSGSMSGRREVWEKAVGLSLMHLARKQNRLFHAIHFGSRNQLWESSFKTPSDYSPERILDFAEVFWGGGTDYVTALTAGLNFLETEYDETGRVTGDIVIATDGECDVPADFFEAFKDAQARLDFTLYAILIGASNYKGSIVDRLADGKVFTVSNLLNGSDIGEVFRGV